MKTISRRSLLLQLAGTRAQLEQYEQAATACRECIEVTTRVLGPEAGMLADANWTLANALKNLDKGREATRHFEIACGILEQSTNGGRKPALGYVNLRLASRYLVEGHLAKAEKHARTSFEIHKKLYKLDHSATRRSAKVLAEICAKADRPEEAARWRKLGTR